MSTTTQSITPSQGTVSWSTLNSDLQQDLGISFKNRIINGAMVISQRNAGASVTIGAVDTYTLDRWQIFSNVASKISVQQNAGSVTPPVGFTNYLGATSLSAYTPAAGEFFAISQRIEGYNIADLGWGTANAKTITISFWVRSSLTGTFGGALRNGSSTRSYPFTYTISSANTWEQKSITIVGETTGTWATTNLNGLDVDFGLGVSTTYSGTSGIWSSSLYLSATGATSVVGTNGATFYLTGVQLEVGTQATTFDYRSIGTELALCQRYYQLVKPTLAISADSSTNTILVGAVSFPTQMRATPTVAQSGVFAYEVPFGAASTQSSTGTTLTATTTNNVGAAFVMNNFSSLTFSRTYRPDANTNSLLFSAEL
jgi:hypothetical protein